MPQSEGRTMPEERFCSYSYREPASDNYMNKIVDEG